MDIGILLASTKDWSSTFKKTRQSDWLRFFLASTKMTGASCVPTEKGFFTLLFGTWFNDLVVYWILGSSWMKQTLKTNGITKPPAAATGFLNQQWTCHWTCHLSPDFAGIFWSGLNHIGGMPVANCRWGEFWSLLVHVCNASLLILSGHHTIFRFWIVWMLFWHVFLNCLFAISNPNWLSQLAHSFWLGQHHFHRSNSHDIHDGCWSGSLILALQTPTLFLFFPDFSRLNPHMAHVALYHFISMIQYVLISWPRVLEFLILLQIIKMTSIYIYIYIYIHIL